MNKQHNHRSDLDALLREVPPEEAGRLREVWSLAGDEEPIAYPDAAATEEALHHLRASIEDDKVEEARRSAPARRVERADDRLPQARQRPVPWPDQTTWRTAALAAVLLLVGALGFYWWQRPVIQTAPIGERLAITLPDGSHVELNSGSSIRYDRRFGNERLVHLDGEAFFDVAKEARPFVVQTFNAEIRVLGTRFNVRAWPDDLERSTLVTLVEGRVTFHAQRYPGHDVRLTPGETRRVGPHATQAAATKVLDVSIDDVTAWRRGDLVFKNYPLGTILREVERRFAVRLTVQPASLRQQRTTIALRRPANADTVVHDLALALQLHYRETSNGYALYGGSPE